jgi:2-polyprenyl-3-methyl-5-hydroxy-6-metoxy-1,4-benzoquinol methylase
MEFDFDVQKAEWLHIPIDEVGYINVNKLMALSDNDLKEMAENFQMHRYHGWRNAGNLWRSTLGLDTTEGKTILDFGCGFGIESLQFAKKGNKIILADINKETSILAKRVLKVFGYEAEIVLISDEYPFIPSMEIDIFYSNGVIHHTPKAVQIIDRAKELLKDDGEVRLMLYSDIGRDIAAGSKVDFVEFFDGIGKYSDWYDAEKLKGFNMNIKEVTYITFDKRYLTTTMTKK